LILPKPPLSCEEAAAVHIGARDLGKMVVLSAAILNSGKPLVARQFVEMTRLRVEGLLSAFPKLIESGRDHTFVETETVRYVYQPMDSMHLVMITNKSSNILEDIETLRLLAKVVQDCCSIQVNEETILKAAFDIVFAFDEVVSFGYRESVTLSQIKTYCEMDSHEEKLHQMIEQSKMNEAREMAKKKQMELAKLRASQPKDSMSGGGGGSGPSMASLSSSSMQETMSSTPSVQEVPTASWANSMNDDTGPAPLKPGAPKKGMMLGKKKPGDVFAGLGMAEPAAAEESNAAPQVEAAPAVVNPLLDPVKVEISEQVSAKMELEGDLSGEVEVVGEFKVTVLDASKADLVCFKLNPQDQSFKYKVHPNLNKSSHANNILEVRDASKAYRPNVEAPLLKWRMTSPKEEHVPLSFSFFHSQTPDGTQLNLEYEMTANDVCLEDVHIIFPCPPSGRPVIASVEPGDAVYDSGNHQVHWHIPSMDMKDGSSGSLEFTAAADIASLSPFQFEAIRRDACKCPMDILECYHQERKDAITYALIKSSRYSFVIGG
jgi:hypothetical protein